MINGAYTVIDQPIHDHSYLVNFRTRKFFNFPRQPIDKGTPLTSIVERDTFLKRRVFELLVPLEFLE